MRLAGRVQARPVFYKRDGTPRTKCALLNADGEGKRSTAILLCIADRAENRSVETQMFGDVQSNSSHGIEHLMNNSSATAKIERTKAILTAEVIFAPIDTACELSASGPLPGAVRRATGILNRQFDCNCRRSGRQ